MPKITLARAYTDAKGRNHKADSTVDLPREEAANLLTEGRARLATDDKAGADKPAEPKSNSPRKETD